MTNLAVSTEDWSLDCAIGRGASSWESNATPPTVSNCSAAGAESQWHEWSRTTAESSMNVDVNAKET